MTEAEAHEDAGRFATWVSVTLRAHADRRGVEVPCGSCTACCRSHYFIHIEPDEVETLRRIPRELLFPAPGRPKGHVVLGYDGDGRCPMLVDDRCSIYGHRPRTCRTYDCRVFAAADISPEEDGKARVAERTRRWRFRYDDDEDRAEHDAVQAAVRFLRAHPACFPDDVLPRAAHDIAIAALRVHTAFVGRDAPPPVDTVRTLLSSD